MFHIFIVEVFVGPHSCRFLASSIKNQCVFRVRGMSHWPKPHRHTATPNMILLRYDSCCLVSNKMQHMVVSWNGGTLNHPFIEGFSIRNHLFWGSPHFRKPPYQHVFWEHFPGVPSWKPKHNPHGIFTKAQALHPTALFTVSPEAIRKSSLVKETASVAQTD